MELRVYQLIFDDELCELLLEQLALHALSKGETNLLVTQNESKVFLGILIASGLCPVSSRRLYRNKIIFAVTTLCVAH